MKIKYVIATLAATTLAADAAITMTKDATAFTNYNQGSDIYDGVSYQGDWSPFTINSQTLTVNSLALEPAANGWIQQDTGSSDWEGIGSNDWTLEATITLGASTGIAMWADPAASAAGTIVYIGSNGTGSGAATNGSNASYDATSNVGTHTFRLAYDSGDNAISLWRDTVLLTDSIVPSNPGGGPRLILGDCCSSLGAGNNFTVEAFSYDTSGAFAPIPEPGAAALLGLGGLALIFRRRK